MVAIEARTWLELLSPVACQSQLERHDFGRVAVVTDGHPEIFPVNYVMDDRDVIFRTDPGTKLHAIEDFTRVAFEIDEVDTERHLGWSVQVVGKAQRVSKPDQVRRLAELPLVPWAHGEKSTFVRIIPLIVSGRRIHPPHLADVD
jgi:nitroimidazol reductase NimA-like FMN-containing flavoprotein (pyridoxamine 5'-phosphate oxidase superfamily)